MKKLIANIWKVCMMVILFIVSINAGSQTILPTTQLTGTDGKIYKLSEFNDDNRVTVVIFWASWCKPCIDELDNIADYFEEWNEKADFNLISVSIDDSRTSSSVEGFVSARKWPFKVLLDENQDLKRAMNVTDIPNYFIFNSSGKIIERHTGYLPGDEEIMFEKILKISNEN